MLVLVVLAAMLGGFGYGVLSVWKKLFPYNELKSLRIAVATRSMKSEPKWFRKLRTPKSSSRELSSAETENLMALGYMSAYEAATSFEGVTRYDSERAYPGFNFYSSGDAPAAYLTDMKGNLLHKWEVPYEEAFPDHPPAIKEFSTFWRRLHLYENGDVLAIFDYLGMVRVDKDSNVVWASTTTFHHDIFVTDEAIYGLSEKTHLLPRINKDNVVREDFITKMTHEGEVLEKISILEAIERSDYASSLSRLMPWGDIMHTNSIEVFDGSQAHLSPLFKKDNVLVSIRSLDLIVIIDLATKEAVWGMTGLWIRQHQPTLLDNGNLLIFDNRGHHGMSKVIELDPKTQEIVWAYEGDEENDFYSERMGSNIRLPNGNTLITETDSGRAFEVTPTKERVWEFYNPARIKEGEDILVAILPEVLRIEPEYVATWLKPTIPAR